MIEQRSPEWFEQRKGRVTASMVGAILGHSPFMSRNDAMRAMVREAIGAEREFTGNVATDWGNHNEDGALLDFSMDTGLTVEPAPFVPFEDWAGASPDGWTSDGGGVEQKCPYGIRMEPAPVPFKTLAEQPQYYDQVQFTLAVTGRPHWWFSQWAINGNTYERVEPDQEWRDTNMPVLRQFYAEFLEEVRDNADEHRAPKRIEIDTPQAAKMIGEWDTINEQLEMLAERKKDLLCELVTLAGEKNAVIGGRKLTLTERAGAVSYAKAFNALMPKADLEPYRGKPSSFWQLR